MAGPSVYETTLRNVVALHRNDGEGTCSGCGVDWQECPTLAVIGASIDAFVEAQGSEE